MAKAKRSREVDALLRHHTREVFTIALLLATPSSLNRAWLKRDSVRKGELSEELKDEIARLKLSDDVATFLRLFLKEQHKQRQLFDKTAELFRSAYEGDPCPDRQDDLKIVQALKQGDETASRGTRRTRA